MKIPRMKYLVHPAEVIPKGYGVAYRLWNQDVMIVLPIPINLIVRFFHTMYYAMIQAWYPTRWDRELNFRWQYGVDIGKESRQHEIEMLKIERDIYKKLIRELVDERQV